MTEPLVSIVIPIYNTGTSAKALAKSLLACSYKNIEILLIDDGSKDDSAAILF